MADSLTRSDLLDRAVACINANGSVMLSGDMGVGKTHLLRRVTEALRASDYVVTLIRATPASQTIPFGALADFVTGGDDIDRLAMLRAAIETLAGLPNGRPHVIAVDDAPLLDVQSIAVIERLIADHGVSLLATVRTSDPAPAELSSLSLAVGVDIVDVSALSRHEAREFVLERLTASQHPAETDFVERIVGRGSGNPLFISELVHAELGGIDDGITPKVRDLVERRIGDLDDTLRRQLELVAAADPLDTRLDIADTECLAVLERRGLVFTNVEQDGIVARPGHPLFGEVVRLRLGALERAALASHVGAALARLDRPRRGDSLRLANWLLDAGDRPEPALAAVAAREALWWHDTDRARRLAEIAVADDPSVDHLYTAGEISRLTGEIDSSLRWWSQALEIATTDHDIGRLAMAMSQVHAWFRNEPDQAVGLLNAAADRMSDPVNRLECWSEAALFASLLGRYDDVIPAAQAVLDHPAASIEARWTALSNVAWAEGQLVRLDRADERFEAAQALRVHLGPERSGEVDLMDAVVVSTRMEQGRFVDAHAHVESVDAEHRPVGTTLFSHAQVLLLEGNVAAAVATADRSVSELGAYDPFNASPLAAAVAAMCHAANGHPDAAAALIASARDVAIDPGGVWESIWFARADGWIAHASGDAAGAAEHVAVSIDRARSTGHDAWAQMTFADAITFGAISFGSTSGKLLIGSTRAARNTQSGAPYVSALTDATIALVDGDLALIDEAVEQLQKCNARWPAAAVLAASAFGATDETHAHRRATIARLALDHGLLTAPTRGLGLSSRQIEVAMSAARGTPSRDIADDLFLSVRTVDNHLRASYRTLGVTTRAELKELLEPASNY